MDKMPDGAQLAAETVVGPSVKIQGDFNSEGNIRIEGHVNGKVKTTQNVYVGESAKITADIIAGHCTIAGEVQGNIKVSGTLVLEASARLSGDITCVVLRVEDGAQFTGKCSMGSEKGTEKAGKHTPEPEPEN
jgi:cytoskeletal protein CcmA (bactofilin family)